MRFNVSMLIFILFASPALAGGPFGISAGTLKADLNIIVEMSSSSAIIGVPKSHPEFLHYVATFGEATGTCAIMALGITHEHDGSGENVKAAFWKLKKQLENQYGAATKQVLLLDKGALWNDPSEWVMSIHAGERFHAASWKLSPNNVENRGISEITMSIFAKNGSTAQVVLGYEFNNHQACMLEVNGPSAGTL